MAPTRNSRSTISRAHPLSPSSVLNTRIARKELVNSAKLFADKTMIVDGITHGWHFRHLYAEHESEFIRSPSASIQRPVDPRAPPLKLKDLECIRTLGKGVSGRVLLVRTRRNTHPADNSGTLFAMKVIRKKYIRTAESSSPECKNNERRVLMTMSWSPFIGNIVQSFFDERNIYVLSDLAPSGTLRSLISAKGPLPASHTLFYLCNILCALHFLEKHGIAHRDLKPDNILLDPSGYLTLVDFGSAAIEVQEKDWIMIGTPCYQAPEVLTPEGQTADFSKAVDWWAVGCILFEMATRRLCFSGDSSQQTYKKILALNYKYPSNVPIGRTLKSLISSLLTRNAAERLGANGAAEVARHPWLSTVDLHKIRTRHYLAPYVPVAHSLPQQWHSQPLPLQSDVPGLTIIEPPFEFAYDDRLPEIKD